MFSKTIVGISKMPFQSHNQEWWSTQENSKHWSQLRNIIHSILPSSVIRLLTEGHLFVLALWHQHLRLTTTIPKYIWKNKKQKGLYFQNWSNDYKYCQTVIYQNTLSSNYKANELSQDIIPSVLFSFFKARHDGILTRIFFPRTLTVVELLTTTMNIPYSIDIWLTGMNDKLQEAINK